MSKYSELESAALALSREDRERLVGMLQYENKNKSYRASENLTPFQSWVAYAIVRQSRGMSERSAVEMIGAGKFRMLCEEIRAFITEGTHDADLHESQLRGLVEIMIRCLAEEIRDRNMPSTPRTIMEGLPLLGQAVDERFPGYARAGRLGRLVPRVDIAA